MSNLVPPGLSGQKEVGDVARWWTSSSKPGCGVEKLRDGLNTTYWQSDASALPHLLTIEFPIRTVVSHLAIYVDYETDSDKSYCPKKISLYGGTNLQDLKLQQEIQLPDKKGWNVISLATDDPEQCSWFVLRACITDNFENGKDTRIRQFLLYSPQVERPTFPPTPTTLLTQATRSGFSTVALSSRSWLR